MDTITAPLSSPEIAASEPNGSDRDIVLTGDRPTGPLHLGHYAGSLRSRLALQEQGVDQTLLIADLQALTDNSARSADIAAQVTQVALDYLAVGIDPNRTTIAVQSALPALSTLTVLYLNFVTVARLERNPTVKSEIALRGFQRDLPAGFLCYPASQAADITAFRATLVPVGEDQLPMIEQTNEIVRRVNAVAGESVLRECRPLLSSTPRLPGVDGRKSSKSLGNAIPLGASDDDLRRLVDAMYTDPGHRRAADPGRVEGNVVFAYLEAFDPDQQSVMELKERYRAGGLGDVPLKRRLTDVLASIVSPIRERRAQHGRDLGVVQTMLEDGSAVARQRTGHVERDVRRALRLFGSSR